MAAIAQYPTFDTIYSFLVSNSAKPILINAINEQFSAAPARLNKAQMDKIWMIIISLGSPEKVDLYHRNIFPDYTYRKARYQDLSGAAVIDKSPKKTSASAFDKYFEVYQKLRATQPQASPLQIHNSIMKNMQSMLLQTDINWIELRSEIIKYWDCYNTFQKSNPTLTEQQVHELAKNHYKTDLPNPKNPPALSVDEKSLAHNCYPQFVEAFPNLSDNELKLLITKAIIAQRSHSTSTKPLLPQIPADELSLLADFWNNYQDIKTEQPDCTHNDLIKLAIIRLKSQWSCPSASGALHPILSKLPSLLDLYYNEFNFLLAKKIVKSIKKGTSEVPREKAHAATFFNLAHRHQKMIAINDGMFLLPHVMYKETLTDHIHDVTNNIRGNNLAKLIRKIHELREKYIEPPPSVLDKMIEEGYLSTYLREFVETLSTRSTPLHKSLQDLLNDKIAELTKDYTTCLAMQNQLGSSDIDKKLLF
ncbi:MAG: hypothetical protein P0S95_02240 [Rhabdochlamydiaceae bacterium]|nr:hypothetical protein [Candidatus Amphrikana amoebophyrae]